MHMYKLVKSYFYYLFKKSKDNKCIHDQTSLGTYGLYDKNKKKGQMIQFIKNLNDK